MNDVLACLGTRFAIESLPMYSILRETSPGVKYGGTRTANCSFVIELASASIRHTVPLHTVSPKLTRISLEDETSGKSCSVIVTDCLSFDVVLPDKVARFGITEIIFGGLKYSNRKLDELVLSLDLMMQGTSPLFSERGATATALTSENPSPFRTVP